MLTTLFLLQSAVPPEAPLPSLVPRCTAANPDEIIVCGARNESRKYRLDPLPEVKSKRIKTYITLAPRVTIGMGGEQGTVGITLKIKF